MNKTLARVIWIVFLIFFCGYMAKNSEIMSVFKDGVGSTIITFSILMGIAALFSLSIDFYNKVICLFWAIALFLFGFALQMGGLSAGIMTMGALAVFISFYLGGFILDVSFSYKLIAVGVIIFFIGVSLCSIGDRVKFMSFVNTPTDKSTIFNEMEYEQKYNTEPHMWSLWFKSYHDNDNTNSYSSSLVRYGGKIRDVRPNVLAQIPSILKEWERKNPGEKAYAAELIFSDYD